MTRGASLWQWIDIHDRRVADALALRRLPRLIRWWMLAATRCGDGWLWYALAFVLLLAGGELRYRALAACGAAVGTGVALFLMLKRFFRRPRPTAAHPGWASLPRTDQFSFPSGHTLTSFAAAVNLSLFYPEFAPALLFGAACIGASRVILGMHYPSDVLAGSVLGTWLGYLFYGLLAL
jgi:undecaprenyl-diphosphatase